MAHFARALTAVLMLAACVFASAPNASAERRVEASASVRIFYDDLAPYGRWVVIPVYGTVWVPASGRPGWHPYLYGRWVWTTDYGWYWDSDEDFGWATYHYGRWIYTVQYGWVWAPDDVWGPAWVDWRYSDGYVGWAPMPPEHHWSGSTVVAAGVDLGAADYESGWVFVAQDRFVRGDVRAYRVPSNQNRAMLKASARVTNYAAVNGQIVNRSVDPVRLAAATKLRIDPVRIAVSPSLQARAGVRAAGAIPLYRPQAAAKAKLDLEVPAAAGVDTSVSVDDRVRALESNVDATARARGSVDAGVQGAARGALDAPISGGIGGVGGGIGGGLRLGR